MDGRGENLSGDPPEGSWTRRESESARQGTTQKPFQTERTFRKIDEATQEGTPVTESTGLDGPTIEAIKVSPEYVAWKAKIASMRPILIKSTWSIATSRKAFPKSLHDYEKLV